MLDSLITPGDEACSQLRQLLLDEIGKAVYRSLNPHNVSRRFTTTQRGLETILAKHSPNSDFSLLSEFVREPEGTWREGFTLKRLRQFEAVARIGRCELKQRGFSPDIFVSETCIDLSLRLRFYHHSLT